MAVRLRGLDDADLGTVFVWESDPAGVRMAAFTRSDPGDRAAFDAHYRGVRAEQTNLIRAIERSGDLVGTIASFWMEGDREISYWVDPEHWGEGIATAALELFLTEDLTRPLYARVAETNPGSRTVLERNGFEQIGQETSYAPGVGRDVTELLFRLP
ncbi:N-acetyltransferase [Leifsonia sp. LS1]|uniref:GNAT family N-acetyltransferase n=1 Tax=Leifsonia sp. LS1 TaxID=2828483 RepID=UPI001CFDE285|nr:GNAT family N-acetyltransferase [Leifsonia sp. LS1]GIT79046.1 N-acetyltransferase [Leifsonia sp. LS1]